ncbi:hypothetical protein B0H13DRAFT_2555699 [Mycena leptocephala]|nr:hypothetical protein B0H13DRAFT_2555699 [Mycena leptocephala]
MPIESLKLLSGSPVIFSNLEALHWGVWDPSLWPYIRLFLGPKITTLHLTPSRPPVHSSLLTYVASNCPSLVHIDIRTDPEDNSPQPLEALSSFILELRGIKTIAVPALDEAAYRHLSVLPCLERLTLFLRDHPYPTNPVDVQFPFPSLDTLSITTSDIKFATRFLNGCSGTPLGDLHVSSPIAVASEWQDFLQALSSHFSHLHLASLSVRAESSIPANGRTEIYAIAPSQLMPVLPFTNLRKVIFGAPCGFNLDDNFIAALSTALPLIEVLCFIRRPEDGLDTTISGVTVGALFFLAQSCQQLYHLELSIDATHPPASPYPPPHQPRVTQTALTFFNVIYSPIQSTFDVASFLSCIFPSLSSIQTSSKIGQYYDKYDLLRLKPATEPVRMARKWREVEVMVPMFAKVRSYEQEYAASSFN